MTTLASQLREIQQKDRLVRGVPSGSNKRPSFLFSEKEAADYDNESIHALAIEGFRELCSLDRTLAPFEERFLAPRLIGTDLSSLLTKKDQLALEREMARFLLFLSPHFLKKAAHKVMEWMVRKWRVNESYVDQLMVAILPYHDTVPFVRMVQIVYFTDGCRWAFLRERVKQGGSTVSRTLLAQRCAVDGSITSMLFGGFASLCDHMDSTPEYSRAGKYTSFLTHLVLETIARSAKLEDQDTIRTYQRLDTMVRSPRCPDALVGAMVILLALCEKAPVSEAAIEHVLAKIVQHESPAIRRHIVLTAARLVEAGHLEALDPALAAAIAGLGGFDAVVAEIRETYSVGHFLQVLAASAARGP